MTQEQLKKMADRLKNRRKELGFTQEAAAERLGIAYSSYSKIENGFQQPGIDMLIHISSIFGLSLDYLIFGTDTRKVIDLSEKQKESIRSALEILKYLDEK